MTRYAIDAPTLVHIVVAELPISGAHQLVAPNHLRFKALDLLFQRVRAGDLDEASALACHRRLTELKIRLLGDRVSRQVAWTIARDHDWPDLAAAEYLAVAVLQADALVTVDPVLAATAGGIVTVAPLEALTAGP